MTTPPQPARAEAVRELRFVFDKFPCPDGPRFIEVEDENGCSLNAGEWRERKDGLVELVVSQAPAPASGGVEEVARVARIIDHEAFSEENDPYWVGEQRSRERKDSALQKAREIVASLSPAATSGSEAGPVGWTGDISLQRLKRGQEGKIYPTMPCPGAIALYAREDPFREAVETIISAMQAYLPPGGISKDDLINRVLAAVDNPKIAAATAKETGNG